MNTQEKTNIIKMISEEIKRVEDLQSKNNLKDDDYISIDNDFLELIENLDDEYIYFDDEFLEFLKKNN